MNVRQEIDDKWTSVFRQQIDIENTAVRIPSTIDVRYTSNIDSKWTPNVRLYIDTKNSTVVIPT